MKERKAMQVGWAYTPDYGKTVLYGTLDFIPVGRYDYNKVFTDANGLIIDQTTALRVTMPHKLQAEYHEELVKAGKAFSAGMLVKMREERKARRTAKKEVKPEDDQAPNP